MMMRMTIMMMMDDYHDGDEDDCHEDDKDDHDHDDVESSIEPYPRIM